MAKGRVDNSNMDDLSHFSGSFLAVLVYYFGMGDIGLGLIVGNAVYVNFNANITIVVFYYFPNICWILLCKKGCDFLLGRNICRLGFVLFVMGFYL